MIRPIPDIDEPSGQEGADVSRKLVELRSGDWFLKFVPWIGGRIISMTHLPSGMLHLCYMIKENLLLL
jgi:alpha-glucosidase